MANRCIESMGIDLNLKKFKSKLCCCCYCCSSHSTSANGQTGANGSSPKFNEKLRLETWQASGGGGCHLSEATPDKAVAETEKEEEAKRKEEVIEPKANRRAYNEHDRTGRAPLAKSEEATLGLKCVDTKWLLGKSRQDNNRSTDSVNNLPHRKSFEMKNIWNYIRNQSSHNSPQQKQSQMDANYCRFSFLKGASVPYSGQRGSSIPETVLLGLLPSADLSNSKHSRQRNSAPTIIQKDKTEKTWERMLKMKNNEKKVKRKTSRLMLKNWVTPQRHPDEDDENGASGEDLANHGNVNVVVIIDKVSPTANGIDHLGLLAACAPPLLDDSQTFDNEIITAISHTSTPSRVRPQIQVDYPSTLPSDHSVYQMESSLVCHRGCNNVRISPTISEVAECIDSGVSTNRVAASTSDTMSSYTAVSSPIGVATKRINSERGTSGASFSRDNSGDTVSGDSDHKRSEHSQENAFEGDDDVIDLNAETDRPSLHRGWRKPDSCSSYSSLNNDECVSLHSQEGGKSSDAPFDLPRHMMAGRAPTNYNYPRKYSLTVPGEPRHMRTLHRRESGSRSPLNSSCGGLSHSELSTPSPSCSNSINDDQSSCSSGALNAISIELTRKCALSVDSLLLKSSSRDRSKEDHKDKADQRRLDALCKNLLSLHTSGSTSGANEIVTPTSEIASKEIEDEFGKEEIKMPRRRKDSVTALIASLLPESLCQRLGASLSSDRIHQPSSSATTNNVSRHISPRSIFSSKAKSSSSNDTRESDPKHDVPGPSTQPPQRARKGSIAQITSASAGKIVRMLRRTHSAGCSKDVPSYALFLKEDKSARKKRKERKRGRKQAPALEDMKQRLRFLRRRHTDSSLHSSTVRPSRDEVEKWSKSFRDLMANRYGCALFRAFLSREYSEENIEFWIACEEYRKARSSKFHHKARKIFDNFLAVRAPKEVNLDHQLRSDIMQSLSAPSKTTFDDAQRKIQGLLESDSYVRFLQSDLYTDLVRSEQERKMHQEEENELEDEHTPVASTSRSRMGKQPLSSTNLASSSSLLEDSSQ